VQQQVSETKATVTIYPKANSTPAADTEPGVPSSPSFPRLEEKVLAYWRSDATFNASVERNPAGNNGANEFVFYDGPPFANGLPHYGHLLTGYVKDIVPRYQTMGGRRVERRFGWDCHGLPAELEAMAQLSLKTKSDIKDLGIATSTRRVASRCCVTRPSGRSTSRGRPGGWTLIMTTRPSSLTTWSRFSGPSSRCTARVWCTRGFGCCRTAWNDETPLSSHELRMDEDVYQIRVDPAVTVGLRLQTAKERMVELNGEINWVPEHVKDGQFGKWLSGARDWSISRNRFWGTPISIWKSDDPAYPRIDMYGSIAELEADFGVPVTHLHRPYIDDLTRPNPDDPTGKSTMRRIEDVLDVWFDSGSMPYAQVHYPFENQEWFEHHYPGDFIVEYIGQTRGWFYTMHILATALFDRPAFSSCLVHGVVLGSDGQKMSKSLRNYPDVTEVFDRDGADAMRWFLMSSPILRGGNLIVTEQRIRDGVRQC
jgi:isoleucyl-tRNA synthetase